VETTKLELSAMCGAEASQASALPYCRRFKLGRTRRRRECLLIIRSLRCLTCIKRSQDASAPFESSTCSWLSR